MVTRSGKTLQNAIRLFIELYGKFKTISNVLILEELIILILFIN